jgi:hypothetical protein
MVTCIIGNGAQPAAMSAGHNVEEPDKRLVAAAIAASPVISSTTSMRARGLS